MINVENSMTRMKQTDSPVLTFIAYVVFGLLVLGISLFMVYTAKLVRVQVGDTTSSFFTLAPTVAKVVEEAGVRGRIGADRSPDSLKVGESMSFYTVSEKLNTPVRDGMKINITLNTITKMSEEEVVTAPIKRDWNIYLNQGQVRVINPGRNGLLENTYLTTYRNGVMVSRKKVASKLVRAAQAKVIETGSYEIASRQASIRTGRPIKLVATAYTYTGYRTATGARTRRGIVAVDPRIIPLGTRLYVEGYGYAVAADTGGFIKGRRIDLFMESDREVDNWGRRTVNVYILGK